MSGEGSAAEARFVAIPPALAYSFERRPPQTASLGNRALAFVLDLVIVSLAMGALVLGALVGTAVSAEQAQEALLSRTVFVLLLVLPLVLAYFTISEAVWGATPGKRALGLRVVRTDGTRPDALDCFTRNLVRLLWLPALGHLAALALGVFLVDPLALASYAVIGLDWWMLRTDELDQRLGDALAATVVVAETVPVPAVLPHAR